MSDTTMSTSTTTNTDAHGTPTGRVRGVAYARVWTTNAEPVIPAALADELYARGFVPAVGDAEGKQVPSADTGLADLRFVPGEPGLRFVNLGSARGGGCRVFVTPADASTLPDDYLARRAVARPRLVYGIEASGPSNSDRNLCENIAEALLLMTNGLVEIGGLGTKGNRAVLHTSTWIGAIKAM